MKPNGEREYSLLALDKALGQSDSARRYPHPITATTPEEIASQISVPASPITAVERPDHIVLRSNWDL
jgi:hypothetical protein